MKNETEKKMAALSDEEQVAEMLRGLKQVAAPNDFEFRVNARIARGRPAEEKAWRFMPVLRTAFPLLLVLVVAGVLIGNYHYFVDQDTIAVAPAMDRESEAFESVAREVRADSFAEPSSRPALENVQDIAPVPVADETASSTVVPNRPVIERTNRPSIVRDVATAEQPAEGGSFDRALRTSSRSILPPGISYEPRVDVGTDILRRPISAERILQQMGINVELSGGEWTARSVRENSPADRSGIKAGDRIVGIDGRSLSAETTFRGVFTGKTLKVLRDGDELFIDIR